MKNNAKIFCIFLVLCLFLSLLAACQDNQNGQNSHEDIGQQVSEEVWNEQIGNIAALQNYTLTSEINFDMYSEQDESTAYILKLANDILYGKIAAHNQNPYENEEQYCIFDTEVFTAYYSYTSATAWTKHEYDSNSRLFFANANTYLNSAWAGATPTIIQEILQYYNQSDFTYEKNTGIYTMETTDLMENEDGHIVAEIKFKENRLVYFSCEINIEEALAYVTLNNIGTTEITLPNFGI